MPAFQCTYLYIGNIDSTHYVGPCFLGPNFFPVVEARLVLRELSAEFDFQGLVLRIPPQRSFGKPNIFESTYLRI